MRSRECGYCDLLIRALDRAMPRSEWMEGVMAIVPERLTLVEDQPARLTATLFGKRTEIGVEIFKDLGSQIPELPVLGEAVPVANNPLSPASMTFVRQCLAECHSGHEDCRPLRIVMPKRLVYFERAAGPKKSSQQKRFRLKLLPFAVGSYAALSHSWGEQSDDMLKTTRTTEAEFMGNIDWDRLPKTLQDGITVAHEMGLQYIWIDSLCIVQDDKVEKSEEMPKMGGIYANAIITIAGSSSPGRVTSFLQDRPLLSRSVPVRFHGANGVSMVHRAASKIGISPSTKLRVRRTSAIARKETMIAGFTRTDPLDPRISGPLSTRGWTLQERILSTRIAHFCEEGIVFECMSVVQHEDQRRNLPSLQSKWKGFDKRVLKGQDKGTERR
ncbi:hypothetical protein IL306_005045 [Fusarium sp. DS 682]|nr:hypothetical protein IL306_005045 [Fusarium sp. DS 682]